MTLDLPPLMELVRMLRVKQTLGMQQDTNKITQKMPSLKLSVAGCRAANFRQTGPK